MPLDGSSLTCPISRQECDIDSTSVTRRALIGEAKDWKELVFVCALMKVLPVTAFVNFMPLIVQGMGCPIITTTLVSAPPFVV